MGVPTAPVGKNLQNEIPAGASRKIGNVLWRITLTSLTPDDLAEMFERFPYGGVT